MKTRFVALMVTCALFRLPGAFAASRTAKCKEQRVMNPLLRTTSGSSSLCLLDAVTCVAGTTDESNDWLGYTTSPFRGDTINVGAGQIVLDFSRCTTNPYTNPTVSGGSEVSTVPELCPDCSPAQQLAPTPGERLAGSWRPWAGGTHPPKLGHSPATIRVWGSGAVV